MIVDPRPYIVIKQLRARDVRAGDVIRWAGHDWMTVDADDWGTGFFADRGALVDVQVRETPPKCLACGHNADRHTGHVGMRTDVCMDPNGACPCQGLVPDEA